MAAGDRKGGGSDMSRVLFSLLDPLVAGRPLSSVLNAGLGAICSASEVEHRYGWRLCSPGSGHTLDSLPFQSGSFDAVLALECRGNPAIEKPLRELARVLAPSGMLVLGAQGREVSRKSLIKLAESHSLRVLRCSAIWPAAGRLPASFQVLWLRTSLNLPWGSLVILVGEKSQVT